MAFRLKALVHGDSGAGKSWLGASTPGPRLIIDAEGGSRYAKQKQSDGTYARPPAVEWNPMVEAPPKGLDRNASVFVDVSSSTEVEQVYAWLASGDHEFNSVVLDSLTEIQLMWRYEIRDGQKRQKDVTDERSWGILLDSMIELCRKFRDLTRNPVRPLWCVLVIVGSEQIDGQWRPQVQGGLSRRLLGYFDLAMFIQNEVDPINGEKIRRGHIQPSQTWKAKDRLDDLTVHFGSYLDNLDLRDILAFINKQEASA